MEKIKKTLFFILKLAVAAAVVYFASPESAFTTGQILSVSGGFGDATPVYGDLIRGDIRR